MYGARDVRKPSVCRRGRGTMSRSVSAVSMARSEDGRCPPRVPPPTASQVAIAAGATHTVISPRWTSARSSAGQFPTWYFVLYFGCTLDFMSRSGTCCRHDSQEVDRGSPRARDPCTNAAPRSRPDPGGRASRSSVQRRHAGRLGHRLREHRLFHTRRLPAGHSVFSQKAIIPPETASKQSIGGVTRHSSDRCTRTAGPNGSALPHSWIQRWRTRTFLIMVRTGGYQSLATLVRPAPQADQRDGIP